MSTVHAPQRRGVTPDLGAGQRARLPQVLHEQRARFDVVVLRAPFTVMPICMRSPSNPVLRSLAPIRSFSQARQPLTSGPAAVIVTRIRQRFSRCIADRVVVPVGVFARDAAVVVDEPSIASGSDTISTGPVDLHPRPVERNHRTRKATRSGRAPGVLHLDGRLATADHDACRRRRRRNRYGRHLRSSVRGGCRQDGPVVLADETRAPPSDVHRAIMRRAEVPPPHRAAPSRSFGRIPAAEEPLREQPAERSRRLARIGATNARIKT